MFVKIGRYWINPKHITHISEGSDGLTIFFSSTDKNKNASCDPNIILTGVEAAAFVGWLLVRSEELNPKMELVS